MNERISVHKAIDTKLKLVKKKILNKNVLFLTRHKYTKTCPLVRKKINCTRDYNSRYSSQKLFIIISELKYLKNYDVVKGRSLKTGKST